MPVAYLVVDDREKILPLCASLTPQVEPYEDEGIFLGLDAVGVEKLASCLRLYKKGSYALAASKLTARAAWLAGDSNKMVRLYRHEEAAFLAPLPVDFLWPLRDKVIKHLKILGLSKIGEAAAISREELCLQLGEEEGQAVYNYSRGIDPRPVLRKYPPEELQLKRSLEGTINKEVLRLALSELLSGMSRELTCRGQALESLCVELTGENGYTSTINRSFIKPVSVFNRGLLESLSINMAVDSPIIEIRVTAGSLKPAQFTQGVLWEDRLFSKGWGSSVAGDSVSGASGGSEGRGGKDGVNGGKDGVNGGKDGGMNGGRKIEVHRLAASMERSLPHQKICFASELQVSRREKTLSLWDPFRFTPWGRAFFGT